MAAQTRAPIAPATRAFLKAAPERLGEAVLLVGVLVPLDAGAEVPGVEVPGLPEAEAEGMSERSPLATMGGMTKYSRVSRK